MEKTAKIGYYAAIAAFIAAAGYCIVQALQLLHLLPPPADEILIYSFSLCIAPPFLLAMLAFHYTAPAEGRLFTLGAIALATIYTVFSLLVYTVQLTVVLPANGSEKAAGLQVIKLSEHSFFWTLDALAYITMGLSTLLASFAIPKEKGLRWFLLMNGLMIPVITFVYFYPHFSAGLLLVASPWMITCPASLLLLSRYFHRQPDN